MQKWVSFAGLHSLEGFFEQERTGYSKTSALYSTDDKYIPGQLVYSKSGLISGLFPKRLVFSASSRNRNSNTPAEVPIATKVCWGKSYLIDKEMKRYLTIIILGVISMTYSSCKKESFDYYSILSYL